MLCRPNKYYIKHKQQQSQNVRFRTGGGQAGKKVASLIYQTAVQMEKSGQKTHNGQAIYKQDIKGSQRGSTGAI